MQWRVLTAMGLLAAVLLGGLAARHQIDRLCLETSAPLEDFQDQLRRGAADPALLARAQSCWEDSVPFLSSMISHDRLEAISERLAQAQAFLRMEDAKECTAQVESILYLLSAVRGYDRVTFQSVF